MKLTRIERLFLSNQFRILESLYPSEADYYKKNQEILESGYEFHYDEIFQHIYSDENSLTISECREAINILEMFFSLNLSFNKLKNKIGIKKSDIDFLGYDGNDSQEIKYLAYTRFICEQGGRYKDLKKNDDFNSHTMSLGFYRKMLAEWEQCKNKYELNKEDIIKIINA